MPPAERLAAADERQLFARIAWRLMPLLTFGYVLNYLDRNNISFAALTMNREVGLTATQFGRGAGILFVGYCLFEIPSNVVLYRVGARVWISRIMISWGLVSAATIFVRSARLRTPPEAFTPRPRSFTMRLISETSSTVAPPVLKPVDVFTKSA